MQAICFKCGHTKSGPLKLCSECHEIPKTVEEEVLSLCLSLECISQAALDRCRKHFQKKGRPPRFKPPIVERAQLVRQENLDADSDTSVMFSASAFDFADLEDETPRTPKTITVHIIGRARSQEADDANASLGKSHKTYHRAQWVVGTDITSELYEANKDSRGEIHVWYRWLNNGWSWSCIAASRFEQLKAVESGRLGG